MPLTDQARLAADRLSPRILTLWQALAPLKSVVSFMNSGAHPDDETSAMLAALAFRDGIDISFVCANRGEGGQNDIGTEATEALGVLRTAEMERAADVLGLRLYWLSENPQDSIFDFGFSKSGPETLGKWGKTRTLARLAQVIRAERPDILCPTFLDVPGQHGHHRAMTQAAAEVIALAADPAFAPELGAPWQVAKLYLPAWSGAGQAYDDDLPPPPETLRIAGGSDPVTGWSFARLGQHSRAFHRTQAMGRWIPAGDSASWPLHLAQSTHPGPDTDLSAGLPATLADLGLPHLDRAQAAIAAAGAAFPDCDAIARHAAAALSALRAAMAACPEADRSRLWHKLTRKEAQLSRVLALACGVELRGRTASDHLRAGDSTDLTLEVSPGSASDLTVTPDLPTGWQADGDRITITAQAAISDPYPPVHLPGTPPAPCLTARFTAHGAAVTLSYPLETTPLVLPPRAARMSPAGDILNRATARRSLDLDLADVFPQGAAPGLALPDGWRAKPQEGGFHLAAPETPDPGALEIPLHLDGEAAQSLRLIAHPHIAPRLLAQPAILRLRVLDADLPPGRVGYIGGGNDRVGHWLSRLGADVTEIGDAHLASDGALAAFDALVIGIFALKFRPALPAAMQRLHAWTRAGGTLVTLYHRPWDNWDPARTAPLPLEIGQPSLRWRVTDEAAEVTHLIPDHPLLSTPNPIGPADWAGWHKERGLYFAKSWDPAYRALLSMADPGEAPHKGALLAADIGSGRHIHCALILHHQMEHLVPGAFRLMANLLARRDG